MKTPSDAMSSTKDERIQISSIWSCSGKDPGFSRGNLFISYAASALIILFRRLLCLAALFLLTTPLFTMESITGTATV